jgi:hypothetical protein
MLSPLTVFSPRSGPFPPLAPDYFSNSGATIDNKQQGNEVYLVKKNKHVFVVLCCAQDKFGINSG